MLTSNQLSSLKATDLPEYVPQSRSGRLWWLSGALVAGVAMLLFAVTRFGKFQNEDVTLLAQLVGNKRSIGDTLGFFSSSWGLEGLYYAPLPRLMFYFEYKFFQNDPTGWHLIGAALHSLTAALVWGLAWRLTRRPALALCAGLIFAVLPSHVPVVAQVSNGADLLVAIFCLASAICFITARQGRSGRLTTHRSGVSQEATLNRPTSPAPARRSSSTVGPYLLAVLFFGLALLCKQEAIALPLVLLIYDFVTGGLNRILHHESETEPESQPGEGVLGYYLPFLSLVVLYLILNYAVLGGLNAYAPLAGQKTDLAEFLRGNLRFLVEPFSLGGTDGLILLAALGAFLALTGVQEWEAWRLNHPAAARPAVRETPKTSPARRYEDDDELDNPASNPLDTVDSSYRAGATLSTPPSGQGTTGANGLTQPVLDELGPEAEKRIWLPSRLMQDTLDAHPLPEAQAETAPARPSYWTLRAAGYGFLWTGAFLLPFVLTVASQRTLYPASIGYALFLAAALAPFGASTVHAAPDQKRARMLFGRFELSFWLRSAAILAVFLVYFATTFARIEEWNRASRPVGLLLGLFF